MDQAAEEALRARIRAQGWDQGCLLNRRTDLFLADLRNPITAEAAAAGGDAPRGVVHFEHDPPSAMIIISQRCDLVASVDDEPLCEAIPLVVLPEGQSLHFLSSARRFLIDAHERLTADQSRRLCFEKTLLPDRKAEQLLMSEEMKLSFRAWCARRASRVPLPDDFNLTVGAALTHTFKSALGSQPERDATLSWRVLQQTVDADNVEVAFIVPYNESHEAAVGVGAWVKQIEERMRKRLPTEHERARGRLDSARTYTLIGIEAKPSTEVSLRMLIDFPPLTLEHLTYKGDEVQGIEPHEENVA